MSSPLNHDVIIAAATSLFRVCIRLYPRRFRVEYGSEMEVLFRRRMIRASSAGSAPLMLALLIAFQDVLSGAVAERFPARRTKRGRAMFSARSLQGLRAFDGLALDFKLGGRMLVRYPGLTVIAGLAMAFGICVGTVIFQMMSIFVYPSLPLPQGNRLVQIRNWDVTANSAEPRALHDFNVWRGTLRSVTDLGAWRNVTRNLIVTEGDARPVQVAEITPSAFRVADGTPLMGRVLTEADERPGAPAVAVIGYDVWRTRFGSDPAVLRRSVQLGTEDVTIVGVMREGFKFPIAHDVWTPLRIVNDAQAPRSGPAISVFGLLAPGATLETAQTELTAVGQRLASEQPSTHAQLRPQVAAYAMLDGPGPGQDDIGIVASIYFFCVMLLVLICSNVALLLFARAATRETELTVRTALGASRSRIVAQMFAEALVLGGVAAVIGLAAAHLALQNWGLPFLEMNLGRLPFWYDVNLSPTTVLFALALTVLGSAIAGVMPALKVTRHMGSRLKQATAGAGGLQFGGIWTVVIVVQVAITVAFPAVVYVEQGQLRHIRTFDAGFAAEEYLAVALAMETPVVGGANGESDRAAQRAAFATSIEELRRRLTAEPGVAGVTFADWVPRMPDRPWERIELADKVTVPPRAESDAAGAARPPRGWVNVARIEPSYFDVVEAPILAGRPFAVADLAPGANVAIVDQGFVEEVLQGRNPIGQQLRFVPDPQDTAGKPTNPWIEIVGVVKELGMGSPLEKERAAGLYLPATPDRFGRVFMMVHGRGDPMTLVPQIRAIAAAVDPALRLGEWQRLDQVLDDFLWFVGLWMRVTIVMTAVALLLSLSGIYAVLSFAVARRTREIGVRVALGATRRRVIAAIFRRPLIQVG
ncbi:MAG TPA: ABC transporter permease, partial [Vicinamibacterales bacterium]|nr:ABC transporter permease [Vicinamibacterales bacterium]